MVNPKINDLFDVATDAYFLDRLTCTSVTIATTASRKFLMNLDAGEWDQELCRQFCIPIDFLPEIRTMVRDFGCGDASAIPATVR